MSDFSIEMTAERIIDARTRQYFREVVGCYNSGYYRSSVVMLWSAVICDLLFKLDQLANAYGDSIARTILGGIETMQKKNSKSPEWESALVRMIAEQTHMFDATEISHLESLQTHRHLSAHPVLTSKDALFTPNRETARAHIRNALESVLTRPAIMSRKVFDTFVEDLEANAKVLPDDASLKTYLEAKYFPHLSSPVEDTVFRRLWRLVFRSTDPRCEQNRPINLRALCVLYERRTTEVVHLIEGDREYFSDCRFDGAPVRALAVFLQKHPEVYKFLSESARTPLANYANTDANVFATAWYLSDSVDNHSDEVLHRIRGGNAQLSEEAFELFCEVLRGEGKIKRVIETAIALYAKSGSYRVADGRFAKMVRPLLGDFSREDIVSFLEQCEVNDQTYGRGTDDYLEVKRRIDEVCGLDFDVSQYKGFARALRLISQ